MATIKLGMFVTSIAGSIGGTTFRRQGNTIVLSNKMKGNSRNLNLKNNRLNALRSLFVAYQFLSDDIKSRWNSKASEITFPDKFGVYRHLSGRSLFVKCNGSLLVVNSTVTDIPEITTLCSDFKLQSAEINFNTNELIVYLNGFDFETYVLFQLEVSSKPLSNANYNRRKIVKFITTDSDVSVDLYAILKENFPFVDENYNVRVYANVMNKFGIRGVWQSLECVRVS